MKTGYLIIGIMLVLALCITPVAAVSATPVAAVSADDFEIVTWKDGSKDKYIYYNMNNPDEKYIYIFSHGSYWSYSFVTLKPAKFPDAPTMVVDTTRKKFFSTERECIYLPKCVDDWEIKFYSSSDSFSQPDPKYLKNAGVVDLKYWFKNEIKRGEMLCLELSEKIRIIAWDSDWGWSIPEVLENE